MRISIAARYRPFSHTAGASCLLPKSCWIVQAFPTLLRLHSLYGKMEIPLSLTGPVREFTLQQDLEKGCVWVWGVAKEGRFRYRLEAGPGKLRFEDAEFDLPGPYREAPDQLERLSFGSHQAQNWDDVARRGDPGEILPILYALSQWTPLLQAPRTAMYDSLDQSDEAFLSLAFYSILCPRLTDDLHQGLLPKEEIPADASPCALISDAGARLRARLIRQESNRIFLPAPQNLSGRMLHAKLSGIGLLDFEWRKGLVRRAILHAKEDASLFLDLPKAIRTFRLRTLQHERGERMDVNAEWRVEKGRVYFLDRFEK